MQPVLNPLARMCQAQLEASQRLADVLFAGAEKIDRVFLDAAHRLFQQQLKYAQDMAGARDPQAAATLLQSGLLARSPDDALACQKEFMRACSEVQSDIGQSLQEYIRQLGTNAATVSRAAAEPGRPAAGDAAFDPVSGMFSIWESAFREVAALARKNAAAAQATVGNAAARSMEGARDFAMAASGNATHAGANGPDGEPEDGRRGPAGRAGRR